MNNILTKILLLTIELLIFLTLIILENFIKSKIYNKINKKREKFKPIKNIDVLGLLLFSISKIGWYKVQSFDNKKIKKFNLFLYNTIGPVIYIVMSSILILALKIFSSVITISLINFRIILLYCLYSAATTAVMLSITSIIPIPPFEMYFAIKKLIPNKLKPLTEQLEYYLPWITALTLSPITPLGTNIRLKILEIVTHFIK